MSEREYFVIQYVSGAPGEVLPGSLPAAGSTNHHRFDARWLGRFEAIERGEVIGEARFEAARMMTLFDRGWEYYRFGAFVPFPRAEVEDPARRSRLQGELLKAVAGYIDTQYRGMDLFCLLPQEAGGKARILEEAGFERTDETCIDSEFLEESGYRADAARILVYRHGEHDPSRGGDRYLDPLSVLTRQQQNLRVFSNRQTKARTVPTLEFWGSLQPYSTFSAYPLIRPVVERLFEDFSVAAPRRLLLTPCGSGDFLRFWPPDARARLEKAIGLDIRKDLLDLADLRVRYPQIDVLNLSLSAELDGVTATDAVPDELQQVLYEILSCFDGARLPEHKFDLFSKDGILLLARTFDELLRNHAIPDWYFPLKTLAARSGSKETIRAEQLNRWIRARSASIVDASERFLRGAATRPRAVHDLFDPGADPDVCVLRQADITRPADFPDGKFDLIISWEFIHQLDAGARAKFLETLVGKLNRGGAIVLTCIREQERQVPQEMSDAMDFLHGQGLSLKQAFIKFDNGQMPFGRRLSYFFPVLVARL